MSRRPCQSILTIAATAFSILGFTATSASAQIVIDDTLPVGSRGYQLGDRYY